MKIKTIAIKLSPTDKLKALKRAQREAKGLGSAPKLLEKIIPSPKKYRRRAKHKDAWLSAEDSK